jgi:hypothetical protein
LPFLFPALASSRRFDASKRPVQATQV